MIFHTFSRLALDFLEKFKFDHQFSPNTRDRILLEKIQHCSYHIWLIASDEPLGLDEYPAFIDKNTLIVLSDAWRSICTVPPNQRDNQKPEWDVISGIGEGIPFKQPSSSLIVRRFNQFQVENFFFILLSDDEPQGLPEYELLILSEIWQLQHGSFPLHACGVQHKNYLHLFTGPPDAGKSTVAAFSNELGDHVIDEDEVLVQILPDGRYKADGWGYGIVPNDRPLSYIFRLIQDTEDRIVPLNQRNVARLLLESHSHILGGMLTEELLRKSFHFASEIARHVPGFDLHFRKSPDFWKLIDEKF